MDKEFVITQNLLARALLLGLALLIVAHVSVLVLEYAFGFEYAMGLNALFHLNAEWSVPTTYSFLLLSTGSLMAFLIGREESGSLIDKFGWILVALAVGFVALDEMFLYLHESLIGEIHSVSELGGLLEYDWLIVFLPATALLAIVLLPWYLRLERRDQIWFAAAAIVYVGGAAGFEMLAGLVLRDLQETGGEAGLGTDLLITVEESLEILGISIFILALFRHFCGPDFVLVIGRRKSESV